MLDPRLELFDELFARFQGMTFSWLLGQSGSREIAEDTLQETFVRVWSHIDDARQMPVEKQRTWVLILARSALGDHRRRAVARRHLNLPIPEAQIAEGKPGPDEAAIENEDMDRLHRAIEDLPVGLRTVLTMSVVGEMTSEEIGGVLGKPAGTIRSQLFDARKRLASRMGI